MAGRCAAVLSVALAAAAAGAGDAGAERPEQRTSYLAARADGVQKLAERVLALSLTAGQTVRDFIQDADAGHGALVAFLSCLPETDRPTYADDGACELEMAVSLEAVQGLLRHLHRRNYKGRKFQAAAFGRMGALNHVKVIKVTGAGAARGEFADVEAASPGPQGGLRLPSAAEKFWAAHCRAAARRGAARDARLAAVRRLGERIRDLHITAGATLRQFLAECDDPNVDPRTFLKGARTRCLRYHHDALIVEAEIELPLRTVYASLRSWARRHFRGDRAHLQRLEELTIRAEDTLLAETGLGVPPEKDWLDATARIRKAAALARAMPPWATRSLRAMGTAEVDAAATEKPAARATALRMAEADARLKLAEQIRRLRLSAQVTVGDQAAENDELVASLRAFQQSARVPAADKRFADSGTAEAAVEIELKPLWNAILRLQR
jgi:hypothetical protein